MPGTYPANIQNTTDDYDLCAASLAVLAACLAIKLGELRNHLLQLRRLHVDDGGWGSCNTIPMGVSVGFHQAPNKSNRDPTGEYRKGKWPMKLQPPDHQTTESKCCIKRMIS